MVLTLVASAMASLVVISAFAHELWKGLSLIELFGMLGLLFLPAVVLCCASFADAETPVVFGGERGRARPPRSAR
ncbi:MAG: hypothetical protein C0475_04765 [Planctomyces sp.]|nr:hypothetical protein [Planctomyces sp.]MBA4120428.1 hypothetical protein [Isosphaera sp.]